MTSDAAWHPEVYAGSLIRLAAEPDDRPIVACWRDLTRAIGATNATSVVLATAALRGVDGAAVVDRAVQATVALG